MSAPARAKLKFGPFELDPEAGELRKSGLRVKLQPQPLRILQLLAERSGNVVTREEIERAIWNGSVFVDFEHGINFSINQIRAALCDDADKPKYIETLPRRGYRFVMRVTLGGEVHKGVARTGQTAGERKIVVDTAQYEFPSIPDATAVKREKEQVAPKVRSTRWWQRKNAVRIGVRIAGALAVTLLGVGLYVGWRAKQPQVLRVEQLTQTNGMDPWGRIATDGARLFYLARRGEQWLPRQLPLSGGEDTAFEVLANSTKIFGLSADHSEILFGAFESRRYPMPLWSVKLVGGSARRIGSLMVNDAVFSPDEKMIAVGERDGIHLVDRAGKEIRKLAAHEGNCRDIAWSPDGRRLRFTCTEWPRYMSKLWEVTAEGKDLHKLLPEASPEESACCGRWMADGKYYVFTFWHNRAQAIWAVRDQEWSRPWMAKPVQLTFGPSNYSEPLPTLDGRSLYVFGGREVAETQVVDARTGQIRGLATDGTMRGFTYSRDGQWRVYVRLNAVWRSRADGAEAIQLTDDLHMVEVFNPRWSPDNAQIVFAGRVEGESENVYAIPREGGTPKPLLPSYVPHGDPDWSPDGSQIVYAVEPGQAENSPDATGLFIYDFGTKEISKVPGSDGMIRVRWSPDGRHLAASAENETKLVLYDFSKKQWSEVWSGKFLSAPTWTTDGKWVYVQDILGKSQAVYRYRMGGPGVEKVFSFESLIDAGALRCGFEGLAPDGSLIVRVSRGGGGIYRLDVEWP